MPNQKSKITISEIRNVLTDFGNQNIGGFRKSLITLSVVLVLILPGLSLAQKEIPQTLGEAKSLGLNIVNQLPEAVKKVWREEAMPLFGKMWIWSKPVVDPWWQKLSGILGKEVEKRKPAVEEEFKKEKEEMWNDIWQKLKGLVI